MLYVGANRGMLEVGAGQTEVSGVLRLFSTQPRSSGGSATGGFFHHFCVADDGAGTLSIYQNGHLLGAFNYEGETETQHGADDFHFVIELGDNLLERAPAVVRIGVREARFAEHIDEV